MGPVNIMLPLASKQKGRVLQIVDEGGYCDVYPISVLAENGNMWHVREVFKIDTAYTGVALVSGEKNTWQTWQTWNVDTTDAADAPIEERHYEL